ncbi:MAG: hypothetical protein ABJA98_23895 [Acidobacteriota bacterium]
MSTPHAQSTLTRIRQSLTDRIASGQSPGVMVTAVATGRAGAAFAAAFVHGLAAGWSAAKIAGFANRAGAAVRGAIPAR